MSRPSVSDAAERLYDACAAYQDGDETNGWVLLHACQAASLMLGSANAILRHDETGSGLRRLHDPDRAPALALVWLAQHAGVPSIPGDLTEDQARQLIKDAPGQRRGTPEAIKSAARRYLTGNQTVVLLTRLGGSRSYTVVTRTDETPDASAVLRALTSQKPGTFLLTHVVSTAQVIDESSTPINSVATTINDAATTTV